MPHTSTRSTADATPTPTPTPTPTETRRRTPGTGTGKTANRLAARAIQESDREAATRSTASQPQRRRRSSNPDRRRDPERTRQLILDAAADEFGGVGYNNARVVRIAERAGVAHQLITYHFGGKRGLFEALSQRWATQSTDLVNLDKTADKTISDFVRLADESSSWSRTLVHDGQQDLDHVDLIGRLGPSLANSRKRQARGEFPADVDPGIVALVLFAATTIATTLPHVTRTLSPVAPGEPQFVDFYADQLARLVCHLGHPTD